MINGNVVCSSFKKELLLGVHNLLADTFLIALYTGPAPLDSNTAFYTTDGEVAGTGYVPGGQQLANPQVLLDPASRVAYATWGNPVWSNSVIVARGALIYNQSAQSRAVAVIDFGSDQASNHGPFEVQFPPVGPSTALIRIS